VETLLAPSSPELYTKALGTVPTALQRAEDALNRLQAGKKVKEILTMHLTGVRESLKEVLNAL
jgi:hypothetical protein